MTDTNQNDPELGFDTVYENAKPATKLDLPNVVKGDPFAEREGKTLTWSNVNNDSRQQG